MRCRGEFKRDVRHRVDRDGFTVREAAAGFVGHRGCQGIAALARKLNGAAGISEATVYDGSQFGRSAVLGHRPRDTQVPKLG
ncbi:hypothetical protein SDC9_89525 [bioreactor metagenome]|uniref:Uncharacterized protein n=1 Tax=bioreactor metagenome TaxID=1076179 RepID=A0A644ZW39_9ZZZZ